jgi:hypothetical protein
LTEDAGFYNVKTNVGDNSATFEVKADFDFEAKLNEIAEDSKHVAGWSKSE